MREATDRYFKGRNNVGIMLKAGESSLASVKKVSNRIGVDSPSKADKLKVYRLQRENDSERVAKKDDKSHTIAVNKGISLTNLPHSAQLAHHNADISRQKRILMNVRAGAPKAFAPMSAYVMRRGSSYKARASILAV
jgi:hypothetical protein